METIMDSARHFEPMCIFNIFPDDVLLIILEMVLLSHGNDETTWTPDIGPNVKLVRWLANASSEMRLRILGQYGLHDTSHPLFVIRLLMFRIEMKVSIARDTGKSSEMLYGIVDSSEYGKMPDRPMTLKEYLPKFVRSIQFVHLNGVPFGQIFTWNGGVDPLEFTHLRVSFLKTLGSDVPYEPLPSNTPMAYREYMPLDSFARLYECETQAFERMYRQTTPNWRVGCSDYVLYLFQFLGEKFFYDTQCPFAYLIMPSDEVQTEQMRDYVDRVLRCMKATYNYEHLDTIKVSTSPYSEPSRILVSENVCTEYGCVLCNVMESVICHCPMDQHCQLLMCSCNSHHYM